MREYRQHIGGEWVGADKMFDDFDPYHGTVMARIPAGTRADAARAVDAAAAAFPGLGRTAAGAEAGLFLRAADIVERRRDEMIRSDQPGNLRDGAAQTPRRGGRHHAVERGALR